MAYEEITSVQYPITLIRNDDWNREIEVFNSDGVTGFDFTGWSGKAEVRLRAAGTSPVLITFDSTIGTPTMTLATGLITLIAPKATTDLNPNTYVWDLEFTDADGLNRTLIKNSPFTIIEDVTQ